MTPLGFAYELKNCTHELTSELEQRDDDDNRVRFDVCERCGARREPGGVNTAWQRPELVEQLVEVMKVLPRLDHKDLAMEIAVRARELGDAGDGYMRAHEWLATGAALVGQRAKRVVVMLDADEWKSVRGARAALELMAALRAGKAKVLGAFAYDGPPPPARVYDLGQVRRHREPVRSVFDATIGTMALPLADETLCRCGHARARHVLAGENRGGCKDCVCRAYEYARSQQAARLGEGGDVFGLVIGIAPFELAEGEPLATKAADLEPRQELHGYIRREGRITHACVSALMERAGGAELLRLLGEDKIRTLAGVACRRCGGAIVVDDDSITVEAT